MRCDRAHLDGGILGGGLVLAVALVAAVAAPVLAPYDPAASSGAPLLPPGSAHLLGTNDIGQDVLSQWLWGARASLLVAALVTTLSTGLAWAVGLAAGLWRWAEGPLLALTDLLLALPSIPLYLLLVALVGASQGHIVAILGSLSWPTFARVVRAQVLVVRGASHVEAARALGASPLRVARVHVLPATLALAPAKVALTVRFALFAEASLGFLGLGDPAARSWGTMLGSALDYPLIFSRGVWLWWLAPPAVAIGLVVLATTWLATGLESPGVAPRRG